MQKGGRRRPAASGADTRTVTATLSPEPRRTRRILVCLLLGALSLAVFWPLLASEFVFLDDPQYVFENRGVISGLTWPGVRWAFTTGHAANWHPLTWLSHMADVSLFGLKPAGHHATSLFLHAIAATLVFLAFRGLTGSVGRSAWIAALFAVHPAHVESVAWISERKDVLSAIFWFATIFAYAVWVRRRGAGRYALVLLLFAAGLMSKPMVVTLPVVLLLLDYWPLGRFAGDDGLEPFVRIFGKRIIEKLPLFLLSIASSVITFFVQRAGGAVASLEAFPLGVRIGNAILACVHYLRVLAWPVNLAVFYPHPGRNLPTGRVVLGALLLALLTAAAVRLRRVAPYFFVGWSWFLATLLPVIGLVQVGQQAAADRYTYIPYVGLFLAIACGFASIASRWRWHRMAIRATAGVTVVVLAVAAFAQTRVWRNSETLLLHAIRVTGDNYPARNNLGNYYNVSNRPSEALPHLREAARIRPDDHAVFVNIGHSLFLLNRFEEAASNFLEALRLDPSDELALSNLARIRFLEGKFPESIALYRAALREKPDWSEARQRLALALVVSGETRSALVELAKDGELDSLHPEARQFLESLTAFSRDPSTPESALARKLVGSAHREVGMSLLERGRKKQAEIQLDEALRLLPSDPLTHLERGVLLVQYGRMAEADEEFRNTIRLDPSSALAHTNLGYLLYLQGRRQEAIEQHREALRIQPDFPLARNNLAIAEKGSPVPARPGRE